MPRFAAGRRDDRSLRFWSSGRLAALFSRRRAVTVIALNICIACKAALLREEKFFSARVRCPMPFMAIALLIQDIVMGKSLPELAGSHPLSPGKFGT
jgi:hypothetical protein